MIVHIYSQINLAKKTCIAIMALVLVGVQPLAPVALAGDFEQDVVTVQQSRPVTIKTIRVDSTAYTSHVQFCDGSPFITADGSVVRDGYVATNALPFGTKIRIPALFGDKIFEVHDRTNSRYSNRVDIWMNDLQTAKRHGIKRKVVVEVIEMGDGKLRWDQWKGHMADLHKIGKYGPPEEPIEQS